MMRKVGFVTHLGSSHLTQSDQLVANSLMGQGFNEISALPWDDPKIDWKKYDILILRSCWNYHIKYNEFISWLKKINNMGKFILNPYDTVLWNSNKKYLKELNKKGLSTIATIWIDKNNFNLFDTQFDNLHWQEVIVKPVIGASAFQVKSFSSSDIFAVREYVQKMLLRSDAMIQPLLQEISQGELSIIYLGDVYSHTVLKIPKSNGFRSNYEYGATTKLIDLEENILTQANHIYKSLNMRLLYARLDGVVISGKFTLMEVELIEPHLFFDLYPQGADSFASALVKYME